MKDNIFNILLMFTVLAFGCAAPSHYRSYSSTELPEEDTATLIVRSSGTGAVWVYSKRCRHLGKKHVFLTGQIYLVSVDEKRFDDPSSTVGNSIGELGTPRCDISLVPGTRTIVIRAFGIGDDRTYCMGKRYTDRYEVDGGKFTIEFAAKKGFSYRVVTKGAPDDKEKGWRAWIEESPKGESNWNKIAYGKR